MHEKLEEVFKHPLTVPILTGIVSFGAGLGLGLALGKRNKKGEVVHKLPERLNLDLKIDELEPPQESTDTEDYMDDKEVVKVTSLSDLRSNMFDYDEDEGIEEEIDEDEDLEDDPDESGVMEIPEKLGWDYEQELLSRSSSEPYILHHEEFYADELKYTQSTLTYYARDDIMVDEDDSPVYNYSNVVGPLRFGHGAQDQNTFYVRNDKLRAEYEIIFVDALYSVEVLGLEIENNERAEALKHAKTPKFRMD